MGSSRLAPRAYQGLEDSATGGHGSSLRNVHPEGTPDAGHPKGLNEGEAGTSQLCTL